MAENHSLKRIIYTPRLPLEYTELEYVKNSSSQTKLSSGILPRNYANFKVISELSQISANLSHVGENGGYWFGLNGGRWTVGGGVFVGTRTGNIQHFELTSVRETTTSTAGYMKLIVDGIASSQRNYASYLSSNGEFYLVNINNFSGSAILGDLKSFKIYGENTLVGDFVPAKQKTDNVVGFYDLVTNTFIAPIAGSLIAGTEASSEYTIYKSVIPGSVIDNNIYKQEIYT